MDRLDSIIRDVPWPIMVSIIFTTLFFVLVVLMIVALFVLRVYKNRREQRKQLYQDTIDTFLNNYLFNDTFDLGQELPEFKSSFLVSSLSKRIAIRQILIYNENLKGESAEAIKKIFRELELDHYVANIIKRGRWFERARAIYVLSELNIRESKKVAKHLNDKNETVRAQAIYFFIKTADTDPLAFFSSLKKELTLWELIQIEDSLKSVYKGPIPDFSMWLNHKLSTVLIFCIRMIQQFNQFEHTSAIVPFLTHQDPYVRREAVKSLTKLNYENLLDIVVPKFFNEHKAVKKAIIRAVEVHGDISILQGLKPAKLIPQEWQTNLMLLRTEKRMSPNL